MSDARQAAGLGGGTDEELPQPRRRLDPRGQRLELGLAAVLLLGAGLLTRSLTHGGSGSPATTSSPAATAGRSVAAAPVPVATDFVTLAPIKGGWLPRSAAQAVDCPADCVTISTVSASVRDAIADAFPGARVTSARTVRLVVRNYGEANWSLRVRAQAGARIVLLQVRGSANGDRGGYQQLSFDGHAISRFQATLVEYHVLVQVIAPAGVHQSRTPLERLAGDVRLLAAW